MLVIWMAGEVFCDRLCPGWRTTDLFIHTRAQGQVYGALFRRLSDATTLDESAQSERASARAEGWDVPETEDKGLGHFCTCTCLMC